jgi:hypothetical protein
VTYIRSLEEIPRFENEAAEAEFWTTHSLAKIWNLLERASVSVSSDARRIVLPSARKRPVTLRLEEQQVSRAKRLAKAKSLSYQALMRSWISEGITRAEVTIKRA